MMDEKKVVIAAGDELPPPPTEDLKIVVAQDDELPPPPSDDLKKKDQSPSSGPSPSGYVPSPLALPTPQTWGQQKESWQNQTKPKVNQPIKIASFPKTRQEAEAIKPKPVPLTGEKAEQRVYDLDLRLKSLSAKGDSIANFTQQLIPALEKRKQEVEEKAAFLNSFSEELNQRSDISEEKKNELYQSYLADFESSKNGYDSLYKTVEKNQAKLKSIEDRINETVTEQSDIAKSQSKLGSAFDALEAGSNRMASMILRAPSYAYNQILNVQNNIVESLGADELVVPLQREGLLIDMADWFDKNGEAAGRLKAKKYIEYDNSIQKALDAGDFNAAADLAAMGIAESAPITATIAVASASGVSPMGVVLGGAVPFGAGTYDELKKEYGDAIPENVLMANSFSNGLIEGVFEELGTGQFVKYALDLSKKEGKDAAKEAAQSWFKKVYEKAAKKNLPGIAAAQEGLSEAETTFMQNFTDILSGIKNPDQIMDGVSDAFYVGTGSGYAMGRILSPKNKAYNPERAAKINEAKTKIEALKVDAQNPDLPPAAKEAVMEEMKKQEDIVVDESENDDKEFEYLSPQGIQLLEGIFQEQEDLAASVELAQSDLAKQAIEKRNQELEQEKQRILEEERQKSGVSAPPASMGISEQVEPTGGQVVPTEAGADAEEALRDVESAAKQKELENNIQEIKNKRNALRGEDGVVPNDKISEFNQLGKDLKTAQDKATRGNSKSSVALKKVDKNSPDPVFLTKEEKTEAADLIEQAILGSNTPQEAIDKVRKLGYVFDFADAHLFAIYLNDRFSDAPQVGNNKSSFQDWVYGVQPKSESLLSKEQTPPALRDVESTAKALEGLKKDAITKNIEGIPLPPLEIDGYKRKPSEQYSINNPQSISEAYHKAKADGSNPELVKAVEELLTPKQEQDAKEQQSGQMRGESQPEQAQRTGDSNLPEVNRAELQDREEEQVTPEVSEKELSEETNILLSGEAEKRRKEGKFEKDGIEYKRNEKGLGVVSEKRGEVRFTEEPLGKGVVVPFRYKLVEAETLQPSHQDGRRNPLHFIPEAQPKNRNDKGTLAAEESFADNPRFAEMGENKTAYFGAPVVNERNEVIQGNNRSAGLRKGYQKGNMAYRDALIENAEQFGFTKEQVAGMKNPVLVREVAVPDEGAIELGNYDVKDLETGGKSRMNPASVVRRMPLRVKSEISRILFQGGEQKTLNALIRQYQKQVVELLLPYLNQSQKNALIEGNGFTQTGVNDAELLVQQFLFDGGDPSLMELYESLSSRQREGLRKSLPYILGSEYGSSLLSEVQNAILAVSEFDASGMQDFETWKSQMDMFSGKTPAEFYTPAEIAIAELLANAQKEKDIIQKFAEFSRAVAGTPADMYEDAKPGMSKNQALEQIFNVTQNEPRTEEKVSPRGETEADGQAVSKEGNKEKVTPAKPEAEEEGKPKPQSDEKRNEERRQEERLLSEQKATEPPVAEQATADVGGVKAPSVSPASKEQTPKTDINDFQYVIDKANQVGGNIKGSGTKKINLSDREAAILNKTIEKLEAKAVANNGATFDPIETINIQYETINGKEQKINTYNVDGYSIKYRRRRNSFIEITTPQGDLLIVSKQYGKTEIAYLGKSESLLPKEQTPPALRDVESKSILNSDVNLKGAKETILRNGVESTQIDKPNNIKAEDNSERWWVYHNVITGEKIIHSDYGWDYDLEGNRLSVDYNKKVLDNSLLFKKEEPKSNLLDAILKKERGWESRVTESKDLAQLEAIEKELQTNEKLKQAFGFNGKVYDQTGKDFYSRLNYLKSHPEKVVSEKAESKEPLVNNKLRTAISEGRMTANDAKAIIESAGLEVPKDIESLLSKEQTPPALRDVESTAKKQMSDNDLQGLVGRDVFKQIQRSEEQLGEGVVDRNRMIETAKQIQKADKKDKLLPEHIFEALQYETGFPDNWQDLRNAIKRGGIDVNSEAVQRQIEVGVKLPKDIVEEFKKSERYKNANPELVKAVEELLAPAQEQQPGQPEQRVAPLPDLEELEDGSFRANTFEGLVQFFRDIAGLSEPVARLNADLMANRAKGWSAQTGRPEQEFYERYLFRPNIKAGMRKADDPDSSAWFDRKEQRLRTQLAGAKDRLAKKKAELAKRIGKESQMSMFETEANPLMAELDTSRETIQGVLQPFENQIALIEAEIAQNKKDKADFEQMQKDQLKLFKQTNRNIYRGSWSISPDRKSRIIALTTEANASTFIHELLGHDYLQDLVELMQGGNVIAAQMIDASIKEFIKYSKGAYKYDEVLAALQSFDVVKRDPSQRADGIAIAFHEFFAEAAEQFMKDPDGYERKHSSNEGKAWVAMLQRFHEYLSEIANAIFRNGFRMSEPMRQVFRSAFGPLTEIQMEAANDAVAEVMQDVVNILPEGDKNWLNDTDGLLKEDAGETELYKSVPKENEELLAEKILKGAKALYESGDADEFNVVEVMKGQVDQSNLSPEKKEKLKAIIDARAPQIQAAYVPMYKEKFRQTGQQIKKGDYDKDIKKLVRGESGEYNTQSLIDNIKKAKELVDGNPLDVIYENLVSPSNSPATYPNWMAIARIYVDRIQGANRILRGMGTPEARAKIQENLSKLKDVTDIVMSQGTERAYKLNEMKYFSMLDMHTLSFIVKNRITEGIKEKLAAARKGLKDLQQKLKDELSVQAWMIEDIVNKDKSIENLNAEIANLKEEIETIKKVREQKKSEKKRTRKPSGKKGSFSYLVPKNTVKQNFKDALSKLKKSGVDMNQLFSTAPGSLNPYEEVFFYAMTPTEDMPIITFTDIYDVMVENGVNVSLATAETLYKSMRDLHLQQGADISQYMTDEQIANQSADIVEYSKQREQALIDKLNAKKAQQKTAVKKSKKKKDLQAEIQKIIAKYSSIQSVKNAMIGLGEDMKNLAFDEEANIDDVEQKVLDTIEAAARRNNINPEIISQIRDEVSKSFNKYRKEVWDGVSESIAETIIDRGRKALGLTETPEQTMFSEFVRLLGEKANELYRKEFEAEAEKRGVKAKPKTIKELIDFAVKRLNDENGAILFSEAKSETKEKIMADNRIPAHEKQVLLSLLDGFMNSIYDVVLPETDKLKIVRQAMKDAGLLTPSKSVNWAEVWERSKGDVAKAREIVKKEVAKNFPAQKLDNISDKLLDIIMDKYDQYIESRRQKLVESQVKAIEKAIGERYTIKDRARRKSLVDKLVRMSNTGLISEAMTDEALMDMLSTYFGLNAPPANFWNQIDELSEQIQSAPEGHEKEVLIEEQAAMMEMYMPGYGGKLILAHTITNMLTGISTTLKNMTGFIEVFNYAAQRAITQLDPNYFKIMMGGFSQGDFANILKDGGINQGDQIALTIGPDGMPRTRILEYMEANNPYTKAYKSMKYGGRILSAADAVNQRSVSEMAYYSLYKNLLRQATPTLSVAEARRAAMKSMYDVEYSVAKSMAIDQLNEMGIANPSEARVKRQAFQNIRLNRRAIIGEETSALVEDKANAEALEAAYKSRMTDNLGLATMLGFVANKINESVSMAGKSVAKSVHPTNKAKQEEFAAKWANAWNLVRVQVMPFMNGVFNVMEKTFEKMPLYAGMKAAYYAGRYRSNIKEMDELKKQDKPIPAELLLDSIINGNKAFGHLATGLASFVAVNVLFAMLMEMNDDEEDKWFFLYGTDLDKKGRKDVKGNSIPSNSLLIGDTYVPLAYMGTVGLALASYASYRDEVKKAQREADLGNSPKIMPGLLSLPANNKINIAKKVLAVQLDQGYLEGPRRFATAVSEMDATGYLVNSLTNLAANAGIPYIQMARQFYEAGRDLAGLPATKPLTLAEKMIKPFGPFAYFVLDRPAIDYRGRPVRSGIKNSSGIGGLTLMFKNPETDQVDAFLEANNVSIQFEGRASASLSYEDSQVQWGMDNLTYFAYQAGVSEGWNDAINILYSKRAQRRLTKEERLSGYDKDAAVAKDMQQMHNLIERYTSALIASSSGILVPSKRPAYKEKMEKAKKDMANVFERYASQQSIEDGTSMESSMSKARKVSNIARSGFINNIDEMPDAPEMNPIQEFFLR